MKPKATTQQETEDWSVISLEDLITEEYGEVGTEKRKIADKQILAARLMMKLNDMCKENNIHLKTIAKMINKTELTDKLPTLLTIFLPKCGKEVWKQEFVTSFCNLSNNQMLEEMIDNQIPDDWDGCMSKRGRWMAKMSLEILEYKLKQDGWLN